MATYFGYLRHYILQIQSPVVSTILCKILERRRAPSAASFIDISLTDRSKALLISTLEEKRMPRRGPLIFENKS